MTKQTDIDEILESRPIDLLLDVFWNDPATQAKIRNHLNSVSAENITHYHKHFRPDKHEVAKGKL